MGMRAIAGTPFQDGVPVAEDTHRRGGGLSQWWKEVLSQQGKPTVYHAVVFFFLAAGFLLGRFLWTSGLLSEGAIGLA